MLDTAGYPNFDAGPVPTAYAVSSRNAGAIKLGPVCCKRCNPSWNDSMEAPVLRPDHFFHIAGANMRIQTTARISRTTWVTPLRLVGFQKA
jgi:hypothetical protein